MARVVNVKTFGGGWGWGRGWFRQVLDIGH